MKTKIVKCIKALIVILLLSGIIYLSGDAKEESVEVVEQSETEEVLKENIKKVNETIAVVNLDEGITKDDTAVNYGNSLINVLNENVKVTSLEDARAGIETGNYSAYIIIPNTFSDKVSTINQQPEKSSLTYALSTQLEQNDRVVILENIVNIYNTFSNNLSQIYTSSILKDYHDIQDQVSSIMERDTVDMELLLAINGYDLVEIIEIPELEVVENKIDDLDLSDNYSKNEEGINNIDNAYKTFFASSENDYEKIKTNSKSLEEKENTTNTKLSNVHKNINKIDVKDYDDEERTLEEDESIVEKNNVILGDWVYCISCYRRGFTSSKW